MNDDFFVKVKIDGEEKEKINPKLVDECAKEAADSFFAAGATDSLKPAQLRKFYNEVKGLELQLKNNPQKKEETFYDILPSLKLLTAKADYAVKRKVAPVAFLTWMKRNITKVNEYKDFKPFLLYFEAIVGFYKKTD